MDDMRDAERAVALMCDQMAARGPDDARIALLASDHAAVAIGNRRLAIIGPSSAPAWALYALCRWAETVTSPPISVA
jgi:asparagine synthetase B (glutamine-hydrolysing)